MEWTRRDRRMLTRFGTWLARLVDAGALPTDSLQERVEKSTLAYTALLISFLALWWVVMYSALGALLLQGPAAAGAWFASYVALIVVSGLADPLLAHWAPRLPSWFVLTNFVMNIGAISLVVFLMLRYLAVKRAEALEALRREHHLLQEEQAKSERLLLNILPQAIAERLVAWLNDLFSAFDVLSDHHGLEKIKTVGDAYMAVAGLPMPRPDHARAAAEMALAVQDVVAHRTAPNGDPLRMRIGLHSGPVVAGVIGVRKFIYDLWGDTVNTASRMESHGVPGAIQVTEATYRELRDEYAFEERGLLQVKGKGEMRTYILSGRRAALVG